MRFPPVPLFVYGSLKRGFRHHGLLRRALLLGEATAPGCGLVLLGDYPALVRRSHVRVHGELYRVDRPLLRALDEFEDCPELYRRMLLRLVNGAWAFAYFASGKDTGHPPLAGQRWTG